MSLSFELVHDSISFDVVYVVYIIKLHDVILPVDTVYETRKCDHSESY